jgi:hypothetical protein
VSAHPYGATLLARHLQVVIEARAVLDASFAADMDSFSHLSLIRAAAINLDYQLDHGAGSIA